MGFGSITSHIDVAQLVLYAFWLFFFGLILYLRYEDQREGYPLENEHGPTNKAIFYPPPPKTYILRDGSTTTSNPAERDDLDYETRSWFIGDPVTPKGDPMTAGMGPGAYAQRMDVADVTFDNHLRIVPTRVAPEFGVVEEDDDPRGFTVYGCDSKPAGKVVDLWVDRAEFVHRYFEVEVADGGRRVLLPVMLAHVPPGVSRVHVDSIRADQFAGVPALKNPDQVTRLEEDKIVGYYGAGYLYSSSERAEPIL